MKKGSNRVLWDPGELERVRRGLAGSFTISWHISSKKYSIGVDNSFKIGLLVP